MADKKKDEKDERVDVESLVKSAAKAVRQVWNRGMVKPTPKLPPKPSAKDLDRAAARTRASIARR